MVQASEADVIGPTVPPHYPDGGLQQQVALVPQGQLGWVAAALRIQQPRCLLGQGARGLGVLPALCIAAIQETAFTVVTGTESW